MINNKGSASIFLIFLFVIMLGAIGVLLECARYQGLKEYSEEVTEIASQSVTAEYYRPLFDDYHLFFMAFQEGENESEYIEEAVKEYMEYSLSPAKDLSVIKRQMFREPFITPELSSLKIEDIVHATDREGAVFQDEVTAYMKYGSLEKVVKEFMSGFKTVQSLKTSTDVLEEKMECEEAISKNADDLLKLIERIDGVSIITTEGKCRITVADKFVKKFVLSNPTMNSVGVNSQKVWIKTKNSYVNVNALLNTIQNNADEAGELIQLLADIEQQITKADSDEEQRSLEEEKDQTSDALNLKLKDLRENIKLFHSTRSGVESSTVDAMELIQNIKENRKGIQQKLIRYKENLQRQEQDMEPELYTSLSDDFEDMESVTGEGGDGLNIEEIYNVLENNLSILQGLHGFTSVTMTQACMQDIKNDAVFNKSLFKSYEIQTISFQYSDVTGNEEVKNPITALHNLLTGKISNLVLPNDSQISKRELAKKDILQFSEEQKEGLYEIMSNLDISKNMSGLFHLFSDKQGESVGETVKQISDPLLMLFYKDEHFSDFLNCKDTDKEKCLFYELEYILFGKTSDRENIDASIEKIMIYRTVFNFISIMSDAEKKSMAKETAVLLAGVTGLEPLIHVMETLILLVWSFDEALVDTAALLQEKEVPIIKKSSCFLISYADLVMLTREKVQSKAKQSEGGKGIDYHELLKLLLYMGGGNESNYRCMDLINQNIKLRYDKQFDIRNCVYSFRVSAVMNTQSKFVFLQHGSQFMNEEDATWSYRVLHKVSY